MRLANVGSGTPALAFDYEGSQINDCSTMSAFNVDKRMESIAAASEVAVQTGLWWTIAKPQNGVDRKW